jgi:predicted nuclease of restriction endonuclease-like (RecB) superfamily
MKLSDEQIRKLLDWFVNSSETKKKWSEHRKNAHEENHKWIQPDVIRKMTDEELDTRFLEYYKTGGGRQSLNQIYRDRIIRDKKRFRETILYLLDEGISIEKRIDQILDGKYRIEGFGKAILTSFLMDFNSDKYCLWNNKSEMGFSVLGWKVYEEKDSWSGAYLKVLNALQRLKEINPEFNLAYADIDMFLHTISAEDEGIEAVRAITEGVEISKCETIKETPKEIESAEFTMEKYLEEFIEANFNKINFGAKLELYQDEERTGRQYPTPIGNIDLLAIDKEMKEFVVIELKKGKSSDVVIGQILRYMGWINEKLALPQGYGVKGIIILKEKDEKLEYALKLMPNVNLFLYEVSFDVKKII